MALADQLMELDMETMMEQSIIEYEEKIVMDIIENEKIEKKREENKNILQSLLSKLKRILRYDSEIEKIYTILLPIIEMYIDSIIQDYVFDLETYNMIIKGLKSIRITDQEYDLILSIIKV
jgi:translation elongation factor EF-G